MIGRGRDSERKIELQGKRYPRGQVMEGPLQKRTKGTKETCVNTVVVSEGRKEGFQKRRGKRGWGGSGTRDTKSRCGKLTRHNPEKKPGLVGGTLGGLLTV